jgi:hypothetical protein
MKRFFLLSVLAVALLLLSSNFTVVQADPAVDEETAQIKEQLEEGKVTSSLSQLLAEYVAYTEAPDRAPNFIPTEPFIQINEDRVVIDAVAASEDDVETLKADLEALGLQRAASHGLLVSGEFPMAAIGELASVEGLNFARAPHMMNTKQTALTADGRFPWPPGWVESQGVEAVRADVARWTYDRYTPGLTTVVGVLSDSFNCGPTNSLPTATSAEQDRASGDLPKSLIVAQDWCLQWHEGPNEDRGRAMMQVIADVSPMSTQLFHSARGGVANFANGMIELAQAGAKVIVDDVNYIEEPMFQDGWLARTVDHVVNTYGVSYFASAGDANGQSYQAPYQPGDTDYSVTYWPSGVSEDLNELHDFNPGPGVDVLQQVEIPVGATVTFVLQWSDAFASVSGAPGASTDLDLFLGNKTGIWWLASRDGNIGGDPIEILSFTNNAPVFPGDNVQTNVFQLMIDRWAGPNPELIKLVWFTSAGPDGVKVEYPTWGSTIYGHANAKWAETVGSSDFYTTREWNAAGPPIRRRDSGWGGTPIIINPDGTHRETADWEIRPKPELMAASGVDNTFFGDDWNDANFNAAVPNCVSTTGVPTGLDYIGDGDFNTLEPYVISNTITIFGYEPENDDPPRSYPFPTDPVYDEPCEKDDAGQIWAHPDPDAPDPNAPYSNWNGPNWPNFLGSSPAVAHAAGVAALMLDVSAQAPIEVYKALEATTKDMEVVGFDFYTGYGFIQAEQAIWQMVFVNDNMADFGANLAGNSVEVSWQTTQESELTGFNVYRSDAPDGESVQVNDALISAEAGSSFSLTDSEVEAGTTYYYKLEGLTADGESVTLNTADVKVTSAPTSVTMSEMSSGSTGTGTLPFMALALVGLAGFGVALRRFRKR